MLRRHALYPVSYRRVWPLKFTLTRSRNAAVDGCHGLVGVERVLVNREVHDGDRAVLPEPDDQQAPGHRSLQHPGLPAEAGSRPAGQAVDLLVLAGSGEPEHAPLERAPGAALVPEADDHARDRGARPDPQAGEACRRLVRVNGHGSLLATMGSGVAPRGSQFVVRLGIAALEETEVGVDVSRCRAALQVRREVAWLEADSGRVGRRGSTGEHGDEGAEDGFRVNSSFG